MVTRRVKWVIRTYKVCLGNRYINVTWTGFLKALDFEIMLQTAQRQPRVLVRWLHNSERTALEPLESLQLNLKQVFQIILP